MLSGALRPNGYMDNEYTKQAWEHEIPITTAPGTKWMWPRCFASSIFVHKNVLARAWVRVMARFHIALRF